MSENAYDLATRIEGVKCSASILIDDIRKLKTFQSYCTGSSESWDEVRENWIELGNVVDIINKEIEDET